MKNPAAETAGFITFLRPNSFLPASIMLREHSSFFDGTSLFPIIVPGFVFIYVLYSL